MFTVCPKCALTLVVTAADLRVAQGYVRCGRCSSVFNALARLSDDRQAGAARDESAQPTSSGSAESAQQAAADLSPLEEALAHAEGDEGEPIPEGALEFNPDTTDVGAVFVAPPPNPQWTAATGSFQAMRAATQAPEPQLPEQAKEPATQPGESQVDVEIDAAFLADMLGEAAPQAEAQRGVPPPSEPRAPERPRPEPPATTEPPSPAERPTRAQGPIRRALPSPPPAPASMRGSSARPIARHTVSHTRPAAQASGQPSVRSAHEHAPRSHEAAALRRPEEAAADAADTPALGIEARPSVTHAMLARVDAPIWAAGVALALLLLVAQIVNHNRDELAANPRFSRPLTALYASLGVQLMPHWDVRAYDVRQLGASAEPSGGGVITLRASIKNAGRQAQPLPLLRVTLQDRFGNRIAARDVAPRFYVPRTIPDSSYLASGQRIDAEMGFVDPGANAVGFEIDACLPASGGGVTCANDLTAR